MYSVDEPLTDQQFNELQKYYDTLAGRDIDFIEVPDNAKVIADSIAYYWETECKDSGKTMIYEIDHAKLVKGREGQNERQIIDELMTRLVDVKKYIASKGGTSIGIVLSQMNRDIRQVERVRNSEMHRPDTSCLFGASSIEQCSDYILFSHIPAKLGISSYTDNQLPTKYKLPTGEVEKMVYFELVKQRSGESDLTIPMVNLLKYFDFEEMDSEVFNQLLSDFKEEDEIPQIKTDLRLF